MWKINRLQIVSGSAWIYATDGFIMMQGPCDANQYVDPPNFIERLIGITFENKIQKAVEKCQKWCDEKNEKQQRAEEVIKRINHNDL